MRLFDLVAAAAAMSALAGMAAAADCRTDKDPWALDGAEVSALYDCIEADMAARYATAEEPVASAYRGWTVTATRPAIAGSHGERFLQTFANDVAAETYLAFSYAGDVEMPVGSVLAKESFKVSSRADTKGQVSVGPLFLMTQVGAEQAPETDGWLYGGILPNGKPMGFEQAFCHDCHAGAASGDAVFYPVEEVQVAAGG